MKAVWLLPPIAVDFASGEEPERALIQCPMASTRLRTGVAALDWKRRGHEIAFHDPGEIDTAPRIDWLAARICIVPKFFNDSPLEPWLDACAQAARSGCRLVIDISDNPFRKAAVVHDFYREVLTGCDAVIVNSERMAELMGAHTARRPVIIENAILDPPMEPAFAPAPRVKLLWFGHPTNLPYLDKSMPDLAAFARGRNCRLTVVTEDHPEIRRAASLLHARHAPALEVCFVEWSLDAMRAALSDCDLVLIPSDPMDPFKAGASANRVAEALNAGRLPLASPLQSYRQFEDAAWLGLDLVAGIRWALANTDAVLERVRRGQARVRKSFAADSIGRQWGELFENLTR